MEQYMDYTGQGRYHGVVEEGAQDYLGHDTFDDTPSSQRYLNQNAQQPMSCDIKPRLTKEQHDILEAHFLKQNKPNTFTKKQFAENLCVSLEKVNVSR